MGELHKEVATFLVGASGAGDGSPPLPDDEVIKGLLQRTTKIVSAARGLCAKDPALSSETLDAAKVPKSTQRFMVNVALAEGLLKR